MELKDAWAIGISVIALLISILSFASTWWAGRSNAHFSMMQKIFELRNLSSTSHMEAMRNYYRAAYVHERFNSQETYQILLSSVRTCDTISKQISNLQRMNFPRWYLVHDVRLELQSMCTDMEHLIGHFQVLNKSIHDQLIVFERQIPLEMAPSYPTMAG